jgi:hypothetical protein
MADKQKGGVPPVTPKSQVRETRGDMEVSTIAPVGNKYSGNYAKNKPASAEDPYGLY